MVNGVTFTATGTNDIELVLKNPVSASFSCSLFSADVAGTPGADLRYSGDGISYEVYARTLSFRKALLVKDAQNVRRPQCKLPVIGTCILQRDDYVFGRSGRRERRPNGIPNLLQRPTIVAGSPQHGVGRDSSMRPSTFR